MSLKNILFLACSLLLLNSCFRAGGQNPKASPVSESPTDLSQQHLLQSSMWVQKAAEYRALCWQAFHLAKLSLDDILPRIRLSKPAAVVVDIDETVLDNSPYAAWQVLANQPYSGSSWSEWCNQIKADTVPGALWFLKHAASKGVSVFYISNRKEASEHEATLKNLQNFGFPNADADHLLLRTSSSNKEARRNKVEESHTILMLCGDNLNDLSEEFEKKSSGNRNQLVDKNHNDFGTRYIVLPNPVYGSFQSALFDYSYKWSPAQQDSIRKANLRPFQPK